MQNIEQFAPKVTHSSAGYQYFSQVLDNYFQAAHETPLVGVVMLHIQQQQYQEYYEPAILHCYLIYQLCKALRFPYAIHVCDHHHIGCMINMQKLADQPNARQQLESHLDQVMRQLQIDIPLTISLKIIYHQNNNCQGSELISQALASKPKFTYSYTHSNYSHFHLKALLENILNTQLESAIQHDELFMTYQPIYLLNEMKMVGLEGLMRWQHPNCGVLRAKQFLPYIKQQHVYKDLNLQAIQALLNDVSHWCNNKPHYQKFFINLSLEELACDATVDLLLQCAKNPVLHNNFYVELYDIDMVSILQQKFDIKNKLDYLHRHQIKISIDDLGHNNTSIVHLERLPIDAIKLDQNILLTMIDYHPNFLKDLLAITKRRSIELIAKKIETKQQLEMLKQQGVHYGMGNYLSQPRCLHDFSDLFT
jgi:EAL domain-containing protein (putative c-di-GMP-specific phosphodiesterase class I)